MKKIIVFLALGLVIFSCKKKEDAAPPPVPTVAAKIMLDVPYGSDANQKMDVYLPENRTTATNTLVVIHGGAWYTGDKTEMTYLIDSMRKRLPNYAFVNINYRLSFNGINIFPIPNNDVTNAINFLLSKKTEYILSDKIGLFGISAGGHMAMYEAYKNNSAGNIKLIVSGFGIADMTDMWMNPAGQASISRLALTNYLGVAQTANPALYSQASPTTYVTAQTVPTQLFHGTADTLVRYQQSVALKNKLQTLNVPVQYTEYAGEGHGWVGANLSDTFAKMVLFIRQYLP
jgi:acetyl esterase/lipase